MYKLNIEFTVVLFNYGKMQQNPTLCIHGFNFNRMEWDYLHTLYLPF